MSTWERHTANAGHEILVEGVSHYTHPDYPGVYITKADYWAVITADRGIRSSWRKLTEAKTAAEHLGETRHA